MRALFMVGLFLFTNTVSGIEIQCALKPGQEEKIGPNQKFEASIQLSDSYGEKDQILDKVHIDSDGSSTLHLERIEGKLKWQILKIGSYKMLLDAENQQVVALYKGVVTNQVALKCDNVKEAKEEEGQLANLFTRLDAMASNKHIQDGARFPAEDKFDFSESATRDLGTTVIK